MGKIHSIETLAAVDGPGLRMAVFLQGCPQRCIYCHNPDTWTADGGEEMTAEEIVKRAVRFRPYFKEIGGVTLSGGEPFMQAEFVREVLMRLKEENINTAVDTCGYFLNDTVKDALEYTDLVLLDIKHADRDGYESITKTDYARILRFLEYMKEIKKPLWIRHVIVPEITDSADEVRRMCAMLDGTRTERIDLLPYHTLGVDKWHALGIPYELENTEPPSEEVMRTLRAVTEEWQRF
jgi:pyruvate formate lyase activating enzyme